MLAIRALFTTLANLCGFPFAAIQHYSFTVVRLSLMSFARSNFQHMIQIVTNVRCVAPKS